VGVGLGEGEDDGDRKEKTHHPHPHPHSLSNVTVLLMSKIEPSSVISITKVYFQVLSIKRIVRFFIHSVNQERTKVKVLYK